MKEYQYILKPYKSPSDRETCPSCGHKRSFSRYVDVVTQQELPPIYGRCNRESNCTYHLNPYQDGYAKQQQTDGKTVDIIQFNTPRQLKPMSVINPELVKKSRTGYQQNNFIIWLKSFFSNYVANSLIGQYHIGTSKHWPGATVFWQIDRLGKIRTGKVMLYNAQTGKRVKKPFNHISWVHKVANLTDFELKQCLFGEHLLKHSDKPVGIVESEKTAIIASVYLPDFTWLACGGLSNLTVTTCEVLRGRTVCLFPDLNGFEKWKEKATELRRSLAHTIVNVSDLLEQVARPDEIEQGLDLADYLIQFDWQTFRASEIEKPVTLPEPQSPPIRLSFPLAPLAWDASQQLQRIRYTVIHPGYSETEYDAMLSRLALPAPNCPIISSSQTV